MNNFIFSLVEYAPSLFTETLYILCFQEELDINLCIRKLFIIYEIFDVICGSAKKDDLSMDDPILFPIFHDPRFDSNFRILIQLLEVQEKRIEAEMKSYTSSDPNDKKKSYRFDV